MLYRGCKKYDEAISGVNFDYCKKEDEFIVEDLCPPLCHELWNTMYPLVYALQNGAELDYCNICVGCAIAWEKHPIRAR